MQHEQVALTPLIAGLAAAVLHAFRAGYLTLRWTRVLLILIGVWVVYLFPKIGGR
jgi:hypothetical protein